MKKRAPASEDTLINRTVISLQIVFILSPSFSQLLYKTHYKTRHDYRPMTDDTTKPLLTLLICWGKVFL